MPRVTILVEDEPVATEKTLAVFNLKIVEIPEKYHCQWSGYPRFDCQTEDDKLTRIAIGWFGNDGFTPICQSCLLTILDYTFDPEDLDFGFYKSVTNQQS